MKRIMLSALLMLTLTGCVGRVAVTDVDGTTLITASGPSRALESKAATIRATECVEGCTDPDFGWRKVIVIRDTLLARKYLRKETYILPRFPAGTKAENVVPFVRRTATNTPPLASSVAEAAYESTDGDNPVLRITIIDRPSSVQKWRDYLRTVDDSVRIEQEN